MGGQEPSMLGLFYQLLFDVLSQLPVVISWGKSGVLGWVPQRAKAGAEATFRALLQVRREKATSKMGMRALGSLAEMSAGTAACGSTFQEVQWMPLTQCRGKKGWRIMCPCILSSHGAKVSPGACQCSVFLPRAAVNRLHTLWHLTLQQ